MALSANLYSQSTPVYADDLMTTTLLNYMPELIDQMFSDNVVLSWLKNSDSYREEDGGERIFVPIAKSKNTTAGFFTMYENINVTPVTPFSGAFYEWTEAAVSIAIAHKEERQNSGKHKILPLLQSRIDNARMSLSDLLAGALFDTTQLDKKPTSIDLICDSAGTLGTIAKGTYSYWASNETASGSFAAQGLKDMRTMFNTCSSSAGKDAPNFIVTTQSIYEYYEGVLQPQERFADPVMADGGFQSLRFKTAPVVFDDYAVSGRMYFLNSKYVYLVVDSGTNFVVSPFIKPVNQASRTAQILTMLNVVASRPNRVGKLTTITA